MTARWLLTTTAVLSLAATLAGCGDDQPPAAAVPSSATPSSATPPSAPPPSGAPGADPAEDGAGSAAFVAAVRAALPQTTADRRDEEIALIAEQACAGLSAGLTADQVVAETRTLGTEDAEATDEATARELIKLAIDKACLDQAARADDF
jgi:hypothetical protein